MALAPDEFTSLLEKHKNIIYKICYVYCLNAIDRKDLAQEIVYHLWKSSKNFDGSYKFSTWMYRVALNVAISHYRKKKREIALIPLTDQHLNKEDWRPSNDYEEQIRRLYAFISDLNVLNRAIILLYLEERTYKEIADVMGISETNVATKINRLKEKLKKLLRTN